MPEDERREYWAAVEVPYRPFYAYEETLAVFGDPPGCPGLAAGVVRADHGQITGARSPRCRPWTSRLRLRTRRLFARRRRRTRPRSSLDFSPEDQLWAEWIAGRADRRRRSRSGWTCEAASRSAEDGEGPTRVLAVVSACLRRPGPDRPPPALPDLGRLVGEPTPLAQLAEARCPSSSWPGCPRTEAAERLIDWLAGGRRRAEPGAAASATRAATAADLQDARPQRQVHRPGGRPRQLREQLRSSGPAVLLPVTLRPRRRRQDPARPGVRAPVPGRLRPGVVAGLRPAAVHRRLPGRPGGAAAGDLRREPARGGRRAEAARQVLMLSESDPVRAGCWSTTTPRTSSEVAAAAARGGGHVLITSRNGPGSAKARSRSRSTCSTRQESISHLRRRVPDITPPRPTRLAEALGDLPLAVAAAGALLANTGHRRSPTTCGCWSGQALVRSPAQLPAEYPESVGKAWDLSLDRLQERDPRPRPGSWSSAR